MHPQNWYHQKLEVMLKSGGTGKLLQGGGGDVRRVVGTSATLINNFMHWFQAIFANMNPEAQQRALVASRKAAPSIFADAGDDEVSLMAVRTAPAPRDVRKVKYSAELAVIEFTP